MWTIGAFFSSKYGLKNLLHTRWRSFSFWASFAGVSASASSSPAWSASFAAGCSGTMGAGGTWARRRRWIDKYPRQCLVWENDKNNNSRENNQYGLDLQIEKSKNKKYNKKTTECWVKIDDRAKDK